MNAGTIPFPVAEQLVDMTRRLGDALTPPAKPLALDAFAGRVDQLARLDVDVRRQVVRGHRAVPGLRRRNLHAREEDRRAIEIRIARVLERGADSSLAKLETHFGAVVSGTVPAQDVETVRAFVSALEHRNPLKMLRLTSPRLALQIPADGSIFGPRQHQGRGQALLVIGRALVVTRGTFVAKCESIQPIGDLVMARVRFTAKRGSKWLNALLLIRFRVRARRVVEIHEEAEDLAHWRDFWTPR